MAVIIIVAMILAFRYRQSNYTPPESTVTLTPPPVPEPPAPEPPVPEPPVPEPPAPEPPAPEPPVPELPSSMQADSSEIGGIGGFDKIAGETMYEYMASDPQVMAAPEMASAPQMMAPPEMASSPEMASVTTPQVEMYMKSPYSEF